MLQAGMKMPAEILDYAPIPADLSEKWKQALKPDPQSQQIQQASVKATLDKLVAEVAKLQAGAQLDQAKAQEIMAELGKPGEDPNSKAQLELLKAQVEAQVESRIAKFKTDREAETKLMIAQMNVDSAERIAAMEAGINAKLEESKMANESSLEQRRMEHDASTKMTVAAIARGGKDEEDEEKEDPTALITEAIGELKEAVTALATKKTGFKMKRDKDGNVSEVEMADGRKLRAKRSKSGDLEELSEG